MQDAPIPPNYPDAAQDAGPTANLRIGPCILNPVSCIQHQRSSSSSSNRVSNIFPNALSDFKSVGSSGSSGISITG